MQSHHGKWCWDYPFALVEEHKAHTLILDIVVVVAEARLSSFYKKHKQSIAIISWLLEIQHVLILCDESFG